MRKILALLAFIFILFSGTQAVFATDFSVAAKHAAAVEVSTGKILYEQDAETPAAIGSVTKIASVYLVYEALERGDIQLDTEVEISDYPYSLTANTQLSNVILDDRLYTVADLLNASLITSSNSAIIALAEHIAGSESAFVDQMKAKLAEWGITDAKLVNVSGLDNADLGDNIYPGSSASDYNMLSALDVAIIARRLILDFPQVLEITSQNYYDFGGLTYYSTNQMLSEGAHARGGVDGLKTGTSDAAGACFVATTTQQGMRIITVVLNATDGETYPENRFVATNSLINYVYENFEAVTLVEKGKPYEKSKVAIFNGEKATASAVAASDFVIIQAKTGEATTASFQASADEFDAPLTAGTSVGTLSLTDTNLVGRGYIDQQPSVEMVLGSDVKEAIWPVSWWNIFVRYVNENL